MPALKKYGDHYRLPDFFPAPVLRPLKRLELMLCLGLSTDLVRRVYREYMANPPFYHLPLIA